MKLVISIMGMLAVLSIPVHAGVLFQDEFSRADALGTPGSLDVSSDGMIDNLGIYNGTDTYIERVCMRLENNEWDRGGGGMAVAGLVHNFQTADLAQMSEGTYAGKYHMRVSMDATLTSSSDDPYDRFVGFGIGYDYKDVSTWGDIALGGGIRPCHGSLGAQEKAGAEGGLFFDYLPYLDGGSIGVYTNGYDCEVVSWSGATNLGTLSVDFYFDNTLAGSKVAYVVSDDEEEVCSGVYTLINVENYLAFGARGSIDYSGDNLLIETDGVIAGASAELSIAVVSNSVVVGATSLTQATSYQLQMKDELAQSVWSNVGSAVSGVVDVNWVIPATNTASFFRMEPGSGGGYAGVLFQDTFDRADALGTPGSLDVTSDGMTDNLGAYNGEDTYIERVCMRLENNEWDRGGGGMAVAALVYDFQKNVLQQISGGVYDGKYHMRVSMDATLVSDSSDPYDRFVGFGIGYNYSDVSTWGDIGLGGGIRPCHGNLGAFEKAGAEGGLFFDYLPYVDGGSIGVYTNGYDCEFISWSGATSLGTLAVDFYFDDTLAGSEVIYVVSDDEVEVCSGTYTLINSGNYLAFGGRGSSSYSGDNFVIETGE